MPERDPERIQIADDVRRELASTSTLTPIQARALVRGLQTSWNVPPIQWSEAESRDQLADARRLLTAAEIYRKVEGRGSANAISCFRRAAEILEWLSRAGEGQTSFVPLQLLAAAAYQLGGLPAMAAALLTVSDAERRGERLYIYFLQGRFDDVIRLISHFWRRNQEIAARGASEQLLNEEGEDKVAWYFTVELVRTLGSLADNLRRGDSNRYERALSKLMALDRLAIRTFGDDLSLLVTLLRQVAEAYGENSIYRPLRLLGELNPARLAKLEGYGRTQFHRGRGILWTSQLHGLQRLLQDRSFALCTPTGSGKTLVANLALVKELLLVNQDIEDPLALYLVPSRALAGEVEAKLTAELGRDLIITGLYGGADWGITDYWLNADRPTVLIATVEKADALMRYLGPLLVRRLRLLIVDEAHQVVPNVDDRINADFAEHSERSIRLESFVSRLLSQSPDVVRIALTAVAGGAASPVARWIEGRNDASAVGTDYRSTRQIVGTFETQSATAGRMELDLLNGRPLFVRGRDEPVYIRLRTPPMPLLSAALRKSIYRFNALDVLWTALNLSEERRILISVAQQPEQIMGWYAQALALPAWQPALSFTPPADGADRERYEATRAACIDYCGDDSYELALLQRGIATNHGQMPQRLRRLMTDLIDRGICPIAVATATLTEGVNLPFDIIFLTSLKRRSYDPVNNRPIVTPLSTAEFRNLAGRAGRPGASNGMEGITLVAIPSRPVANAAADIRTQRTQISQLETDYRRLRRALLRDEAADQSVNSPLALLLQHIADLALELFGVEGDDFLEWLEAAIVPDVSEDAGRADTSDDSRLADCVDELDGVLLSALHEIEELRQAPLPPAAIEAALQDLWQRTFSAYAAAQENWLERAFVRRGRGIIETVYPDADERARLYQYGFTPYVGRRFEAIAPQLKAVIEAAVDYGSATADRRLEIFFALGDLLVNDRGYGFRVRATETDRRLLADWQGVFRWWMKGPEREQPNAAELRAWQRFVSDNIEFRLGVAVGAIAARAWSEGAAGPLTVPSLEDWKEVTGLPWFGFWARELLRWGTLDPFVAWALGQGLAGTREDAAVLQVEFEEWLDNQVDIPTAEDLIDPQRFLAWQRSLHQPERDEAPGRQVRARLVGTTGQNGRYHVVPIIDGDVTKWIDAAGYILARSRTEDLTVRRRLHRQDFTLRTDGRRPYVEREFAG